MRRKMFTKDDVRAIMREFDVETGNDTSAIRVRIVTEVEGQPDVVAYYACNSITHAPIEFVFTRAMLRCSYEFMWDTIAHEYAHYVTNTVQHHINMDDLHDEVFIDNVYALGSANVSAHIDPIMHEEYMTARNKYRRNK